MSNDFVWGTETYRAFALELGSNGAPLATSTAVYEGLEIEGVQDFVPNFPTPRAIAGVAQGRVRDTIYLPSIEAQTATMHALYDILDTNAKLMGVKKQTIATREHVAYQTNKGGQEPDVALIVSRLVTHNQDGSTVWNHYLLPRARVLPTGSPFDANASKFTYNVAISKALKHIWGTALTEALDGCTEMGLLDIVSNDRLNIVAYKSDGSEDNYLLPVAKPAVDAGVNMKVYDYTAGTDITAHITPTALDFTIGGGYVPALNSIMVAVYEF